MLNLILGPSELMMCLAYSFDLILIVINWAKLTVFLSQNKKKKLETIKKKLK